VSAAVVPISPPLVRGAARAIADGFLDNEIWVWTLRRDWQRRRVLPRYYRAMIRRVFAPRGAAWTTTDTRGGALWIPPGTEALSARERFAELVSLLPEGVPALSRGTRMEELMVAHRPQEPHWYLSTLSVESASQGRGIGSALMEPGIARIDADGLGAYLETQRRANIPFYRRFGFEERGEIGLPDSPPLWRMWRPPRAGLSDGGGGP
jgi:GNAT superfamily N-acetyltransferase